MFSSTNYFRRILRVRKRKLDSSLIITHHYRCRNRNADPDHLQATQGKGEAPREVLLIATAVLAIGGAGIAACFTAIMHVDAAARLRCDRKSRRRCGMPRQFTAGRNSALDFSE